MYYLPKEPGIYSLSKAGELYIGKNGWYIDAITAADYFNGKLYVTTYNRIIRFNFANNKVKKDTELQFSELTQKEGIVVKNENELFIVDEKHRILGGGNLIKMQIKNDKH